MAWYEHQPIRWILENLTARQITHLIMGTILVAFLTGSYYVYLDTLQAIRSNPDYLWMFQMIIIMFIIFLIAIIPILWRAAFLLEVL